MREEISKLGPVFVKCGQTLAERPDLIGDEAANALKLLQGENTPFPNDLAWNMIVEDLDWPGPLAPNVPFRHEPIADPANAKLLAGESLFKWMSEEPLAAASLAQVRARAFVSVCQMSVRAPHAGLAAFAQEQRSGLGCPCLTCVAALPLTKHKPTAGVQGGDLGRPQARPEGPAAPAAQAGARPHPPSPRVRPAAASPLFSLSRPVVRPGR